MDQRTGTPPPTTTPDDLRPLDWSRAKIGDPAPCIACGRPALLRHPETGQPHHKVCSEPEADVRVFHREDGWVFSIEPGTQPCTVNRLPEGGQDCTATAVWKVVKSRALTLTLSVWCDGHLSAEHRVFLSGAPITPCHLCGKPASLQGPEGRPEHWTCRRKAGGRG